jgi:hypothetical protein
LRPLTHKPVNIKYVFSSSLAFGISDTTTGFISKLVVSHDPFVVAVMPKGRIEVKLTNVRRCSQMFFTLVIVNYQKKRDKRTNNDLQNITQKTNDRATCICISE